MSAPRPAQDFERARPAQAAVKPSRERTDSQLGLGLRECPRPLVLARICARTSLADYRLPDDGRKWKVLAHQRMHLVDFLAVHGNPDGSQIWVGVDSMVKHLPFSKRAVFYLLDDLRKLRMLDDAGLTSRRGTRVRRLNLDHPAFRRAAAELTRKREGQGVQDSRLEVQDSSLGVQDSDGTQPFLTLQTEKQNTRAQETRPVPPLPYSKQKPENETQRVVLPQQIAYAQTRELARVGEGMLKQNPTMTLGDLREELKLIAARKGFGSDGDYRNVVTNAEEIAERRAAGIPIFYGAKKP